jgi:hypothetical protein
MTNLIKVSKDSVMSGDVFYGSIRINGKDVGVSNLLKYPYEKYKFRMTCKAQAGFQMIKDVEGDIGDLLYSLDKNTTVVEVERVISGKSYWFHILTMKGGKWHSIDKTILDWLTVSDMHRAFPKMIDWDIWKAMGCKTHADFSFVINKK